MQVYLFDIDGTLVRTGGAGVEAMKTTLSEDFLDGRPIQKVNFSGRTDRAIARDMFLGHGVADTQENWDRYRAAYLPRLSHNLPRFEGGVPPGVTELLDQLGTRPEVALGLLTGNVADAARSKLEHYGLAHHFSFGAFGDDRIERDDLARDAYDDIKRRIDGQIAPDQIWVVGDTPLDIQCARAIGAKALAVATGWHTSEQLAACEPDFLFDDLAATEQVLSALGAK
jgi:phosphoglycolate phosphatase